VTLDLPIVEKMQQRWRSYSIAAAPDHSNKLELCIALSPDGPGSRYLIQQVQEGDVLKFKGPEGGFVLPEIMDKDLVFICTGTGIAPFRSMLQYLKNTGKAHKKLHLIFGTRTEADILYREEMQELSKTLPGFQYDIALSRQPDWNGPRGYVHPVYMAQYQNPRPDVAFYICGWSNMIDEAVANLFVKLGYDRSQIHYELYG
jgi:CDP-4-dehydro-6-deoxyglucose reductase